MASNGKRILVFGADGLRPDLFDPELMPYAAHVVASGTWFGDHHAAYPSHTRVNASTLSTGTSPGRHGIVANTMLVPGATDDHIVDTSQYQHLDALARSDNGHAQLVTSLSDILVARGERVAVAGTGSSGSNALWTFNDRGRIVNPNSTFGIADLYDLREKLGPAPERGAPSEERLQYATRAVTELYLGDPANRVIVLWLAEPDSSLHKFGLGSPESRDAMAAVDACLGLILEAIDAQGMRDQFEIVFLSDHGHSTVRAHKSLREFLADARKDLGGHIPNLATASDFVYATPGTAEPTVAELAPLAEWLDAQPWVDVIAGGLDGLEQLPGVIPLRELWNGQVNPRRPLLAVSPAWSDDANAFGVPGTVAALTTQGALKSSHGSLSPYDMHATFFASGPSFREGWRSEVPTGAIDLLPTILHLLEIEAPSGLDGRVVREALAGNGAGMPEVQDRLVVPVNPGRVSRDVTIHQVDGTHYVHGSANHGDVAP